LFKVFYRLIILPSANINYHNKITMNKGIVKFFN